MKANLHLVNRGICYELNAVIDFEMHSNIIIYFGIHIMIFIRDYAFVCLLSDMPHTA